jgi:sugar transferase (PEP-CTERM/EpsH1 system associated)
MKILYLAHRIPYPPDKGEKIRAFHQLNYLLGKHEVHLACLVDDPQDLEHLATLERDCASVDSAFRGSLESKIRAALALPTREPLSEAMFRSRELQAKVSRRLEAERFDVIVVYCSSVAGYVLDSPVPKVMDFVDADSEKWRQYAETSRPPLAWLYRTEAARLARREEELARLFDHSILISEREADVLRRRVQDRPISVVANGVDLEYFTPDREAAEADGERAIVFTGVMDYFPNVDAVSWFCDEVFPLIRARVPTAHFYIVGRTPSRRVEELGRRPHVTVTGTVPDVRPYLSKASVVVAPLRIARGLQNKVLEAMAMGAPVVTTPDVVTGIQATVADGLRAAERPDEFAGEVLGLLEDRVANRKLAERARNYVETHHRWEDVGARLEQVILGIAGSTDRALRPARFAHR